MNLKNKKNKNKQQEHKESVDLEQQETVNNNTEHTEDQQTQEQECPENDCTAEEETDDVSETTADNDNLSSLEKELQEAKATIEMLNDKYLRCVAEFDNYKKRTLKEKAELILNGGEKTITTILPIIDDMERAAQNASKSDDIQAVNEGWELIHKKLIKILQGLGLNEIETKDATFDVDFHEAIAMIPAPTPESVGKVMDCVQKGYKLNEKVIRHAKVAVGQ